MPGELERAIARHVATCPLERIPAKAIAVAKRSLVDGVAAMIAGRSAEGMDALHALAERWGGAAEARVFASGRRTTAPTAAWVNGAQMRALELDDCTDAIPIHPTAAVLAGLLAAADSSDMSGASLLRALAIGQDLHVRFATAVRANAIRSGRNDGYRVFAATAAVAAGLGLDEDATLRAMGLSTSHAAVDLQSVLEGAMAFWVQFGITASAAIHGTLLARLGVTAPTAFLTGPAGWFRAVEPEHDASALTDGLGERFDGIRISVKPYASCRATHAMIDLALAFREGRGAVPVEAIERIDVTVSPEVHRLVAAPRETKLRPPTSTAAQFSAYFTTASALLHGRLRLEDTAPSRLHDPQVLALAEKVHVTSDESHRASDVIGRTDMTIRTTGGERRGTSDRPLGGPGNPIPEEMLVAKLRDCVARSGRDVAPRDLDRFLDRVADLERTPLARTVFDPFA